MVNVGNCVRSGGGGGGEETEEAIFNYFVKLFSICDRKYNIYLFLV